MTCFHSAKLMGLANTFKLKVQSVDRSALKRSGNFFVQVAAAIRAQEDRLGNLFEALTKSREQEMRSQHERNEALREQLHAQHTELVAQLTATIQTLAVQPVNCESCGHQQARPMLPNSLRPTGAATAATTSYDEAGPSGSAAEQQPRPAVADERPPDSQYQYLDPARLVTVNDVRKEFEEDGPNGRKSIISMDRDDPKLQWRSDFRVDRRRLNDIKVLYDAVVVLARHDGSSRETAASKLESWRRRDKDSLRQFYYKIRKIRKIAKDKHETATQEVKESRIELDFGNLLARHCLEL